MIIDVGQRRVDIDEVAHTFAMRRARSTLMLRFPFQRIENGFPDWPGLRELFEREMPPYLSFHQSPTDRCVLEPNYTWAQRIWSMSPTTYDAKLLESLYGYIIATLQPCFPVFDLQRWHGMTPRKMDATSYDQATEITMRHDRQCEALGIPTFMALWSHRLGIKQAV